MNPGETLAEVNSCFQDWAGLLANKNASLRRKILAWPNYTPSIEGLVSWDTVAALASNKQYSLQLFDGSIIQLVYDFSGRSDALVSATLAYFENRPPEDQAEDEETDIFPIEEPVSLQLPRWIRLDFQNAQPGTCIHSASHLHLSGFPQTRISCSGIPGPRQFLEAIFAWFYPDLYHDVVLRRGEHEQANRYREVNRLCHLVDQSDQHNMLLHLSLPPSIRHTHPRAKN